MSVVLAVAAKPVLRALHHHSRKRLFAAVVVAVASALLAVVALSNLAAVALSTLLAVTTSVVAL